MAKAVHSTAILSFRCNQQDRYNDKRQWRNTKVRLLLPYAIQTVFKNNWDKRSRDIEQHIADINGANRFFALVQKNNDSEEFVKQLLQHHPILNLFMQTIRLQKQLISNADADQLPFDIVKNNYFGVDIHLPVKSCWVQKKAKKSTAEKHWINIGGLNKEQFKQAAFTNQMRTLAGQSMLNTTLQLDYAEYYRLVQPLQNSSFLDIAYGESHLETIVNDAWYKQEKIELQATDHLFNH